MNIVVSYRREDAAGHAGRLHADLSERFGNDCVFLDITIKPGEDWEVAIEREISSCDVFLAVIGKQWLDIAGADGRRRLDDPEDILRMEVEEALNRDVRVVPVLVQDAVMPTAAELPPDIKKLARHQAHELSDTRWDYDVGKLAGAIEEIGRAKQAAVVSDEEPTEPEPESEPPKPERPKPVPGPPDTDDGTPVRWRLLVLVGAAVLAVVVVGVVVSQVIDGDGPADETDTWSLADTSSAGLDSPPAKELNDVAAEPGGRAVAVGGTGTFPLGRGSPLVATLTGDAWSSSEFLGSGVISAVLVSQGSILAVGSIGFGAGQGVNGMIWRRSGTKWISTCDDDVCGGEGKEEVLAISTRPGGLIAVGRATGSSDDKFDALVWLSGNGRDWEAVAEDDEDLQGELDQVLKGVIAVQGRLIAVGRDGRNGAVWISQDGVDWTPASPEAFASDGAAIELEAVETLRSAPGTVVAVGKEGNRAAAWISVDGGAAWTRATVTNERFQGQTMIDVIAAPPGLVAVGSDDAQAAVWTSVDGREWVPVASDSFSGLSGMRGVAKLSSGTLAAVGVASEDARIWVSKPEP